MSSTSSTVVKVGVVALALATVPALLIVALLSTILMLGQGSSATATASVTSVPGIPGPLLKAYHQAAATAPQRCKGMRWQILAGIGEIESGQVAGRTISDEGDVSPAIIGPALDGTGGTALIRDTDDGRLDGDSTFDRAVGPLQFIPTSWTFYTTGPYAFRAHTGADPDPNNVYDNTRAAVNHLCGTRTTDLSGNQLHDALFAYNHSSTYVDQVLKTIVTFDNLPVAEGPSGSYTGACDVDRDLPRPNPNSCKQAVVKAITMVKGECVFYQLCLGATAIEYGWDVSGEYSALTQWHDLLAGGWAHPGDRDPPIGALLYWNSSTFGHIAIYIGGGKIVSNDIRRSGCMDVVDWDAPERQWGQRYLGWTVPYYPNGAGRS